MSNLACGIVGLPNVGKSTLFNALTKQMVAASNFPFCTIEPNVGIVPIPDPRLSALSALTHSEKIVPAAIRFVDIAGLVEGAAQGEGLGNKFLHNIRETDLIVHVVRCFENDNIVHVHGKCDPIHDIEVINLELILADLQTAEKVLERMKKEAKGKKELPEEVSLLQKIVTTLEAARPIRSLELKVRELSLLKTIPFLTQKPVLYAPNVAEEDLPGMTNPFVEKVISFAREEGAAVVPICARFEEELASLSEVEAAEFLASFGISETGLQRLIKTAFAKLGLITYYTTGEKETRAWTVTQGSKAPEAAGKIHTDLQKGFIRAEVISYDDFMACKSREAARKAGKARVEGKEYVVTGDDVIEFFHN
ncbi:MAG: redox-regulated ATPase YchF [Chlamydiae bacterium RIFCSPHIGHO2_12_FULL_49_11]|nr:MAG: redox-regulated ATPase YchF [Chlamydiae bacterium RIFCSPHIGHO2_12_FULL_49_11]